MSNEIEHICNGQSDGQHGRAGHGGRQMQSNRASESCKSARASEPSATSSSACMHIASKIETCVPRMEQKGMSAQNKPRQEKGHHTSAPGGGAGEGVAHGDSRV